MRNGESRVQRLLDSRYFLRIATFALFAFAWEIFAVLADDIFIPTFSETIAAVAMQVASPEVWEDFAISNQALVIGFLLSVALGIPLGLLIARFPIAERVVNPYLDIMLLMPVAAIIPLLVLATGIGLVSRVIIVFMFAFVMVVVNTRVGVRQVDPSLIEMVRTFGAGELTIWRRVILPGAMPTIMGGLRLALGRGVTGMVIVELLLVSVGIGGLILRQQAAFNAAGLYATVVLVIVEALVLLWLADLLQARLTPWTSVVNLRE